MSATVETSAPSTSSWRKRRLEEDTTTQLELKRPRYYYRLESESSKASEEDTESVYSLQDRETDVVRDTSDTDSKSGFSDPEDEYEVIEYEVASLSGTDNEGFGHSSSGSEDMILAAAAAAICDSSLEKWITDCEESDNSSLDDSAISRGDFSTCAQCKSLNVNPLYRYCEKCYQSCRQCKKRKTYKGFPLCISCHKDRKRFFPPRPRGNRKLRKDKKTLEAPVRLDTLRSCLSGLSQDSGVGSSQECPPLELDRIVVPDEHLQAGTSEKSSDQSENLKTSSLSKVNYKNRKRQISESSLSDFEVKKPKIEVFSQTSDLGSEISTSSSISTTENILISESVTNQSVKVVDEVESTSIETGKKNVYPKESSELCIFCNNAPKDSIFLHTNIAHQCCCYKCAKRTLHTIKRCPICNRSVNKVVKIYTA